MLLEMIPLLRAEDFGTCSVTVAFFTNEEPPWFQTEAMGSRVFARSVNKEDVIGMVSIESVGYVDENHDQNAPPPLGLFFPEQGNFLAFVGNLESRDFLSQALSEFRRTGALPAEGISTFETVEGVGWSDHWSFWQEGVSAIMVSDTALFRNPHYHRESDIPETLNYDAMARVAVGMSGAIVGLLKSNAECRG